MVILVCWVILFPFALYTSSRLLYRKKLSTKKIVAILSFPLGAIFYWIYIRLLVYKQSLFGTDIANDVSATEELGSHDEISEELLDVVDGPFRKSQNNTAASFKLPWECILTGGKLILIVIKTFVTNMITRLYIMLLFTIFFIIKHVKVQPFSNNLLNYMEASPLFILTAFCALNILPANSYMFPNYVSPFSKTMFETFMRIETVLTLVFSLVIGCCVAVWICMRIIQLIFWICGVIVKIIRVCTKLNPS